MELFDIFDSTAESIRTSSISVIAKLLKKRECEIEDYVEVTESKCNPSYYTVKFHGITLEYSANILSPDILYSKRIVEAIDYLYGKGLLFGILDEDCSEYPFLIKPNGELLLKYSWYSRITFGCSNVKLFIYTLDVMREMSDKLHPILNNLRGAELGLFSKIKYDSKIYILVYDDKSGITGILDIESGSMVYNKGLFDNICTKASISKI